MNTYRNTLLAELGILTFQLGFPGLCGLVSPGEESWRTFILSAADDDLDRAILALHRAQLEAAVNTFHRN